jgi:hypothetical protein
MVFVLSKRYAIVDVPAIENTCEAQDPFEIHIYEYEPLSWNQYSLEAHLNFVTQSTSTREGSLLPTLNHTHLTLEPTFGISPNFAVGLMFLNAWQSGYSPQFAGWRVLPHFYAQESWRLPVRLGFVAEFSFQKTRYEENSRRSSCVPFWTVSLRDGKLFSIPYSNARCTVRAPGMGGNFERAALLRWKLKPFSPSLEYYGEIESINVLLTPSRKCTNCSWEATGS